MPVFDYTTYPFRDTDIVLPECNNGLDYMLIGTKNQSFVYIGETKFIRTREQNHNSGNGSI